MLALVAPLAHAGQIVWIQAGARGGGALWAANDDGTYPHRLIAAPARALATALPAGTLRDPDIFQKGGSTVLVSDTISTFSAPSPAATCAAPCTRTLALAAGTLTAQFPAPPPAGAAFESQPRLTANGQIVDQYSLYPNATQDSLGAASASGIYVRPFGAPDAGGVWADTATEALPQRADPAPDPANPSLLAWVENQDPACTRFVDSAGAAICQYAIHVASAATVNAPPVAIFAKETPFGAGPSSLSWSSDGRMLLIVDDQPPSNGIYTVSASTAVDLTTKKITELIAEPPGWSFGQARFAGTRVVFDARGNATSAPGTSDIYSISAGCDSGICSFPADAINLTHNPTADNIEPAWTSAAAPLVALGKAPAPGAPPVLDAAAILARTVSAKSGVSFEVTLSQAGSLQVSISRNGHTIGTSTVRLPAGASRFTIKQSGGHALTRGRDVAKLRIKGSTVVRYSASFTVR